jgi:hypothetical protein
MNANGVRNAELFADIPETVNTKSEIVIGSPGAKSYLTASARSMMIPRSAGTRFPATISVGPPAES